MKPYYRDEWVTLYHGDCLDMLATLPGASVDAVVTDPPYGLEFMGKEWDAPWKASSVGRGVRVAQERADEMTATGAGHSTSAGPYLAARVDSVRVAGLPFQQWCQLWAAECLRVLKPGGHMLAFGGTRTWHRLACAVEDAGFEVRDSIAWLYGSGFPKSMDVSKAIDKAAGAVREVVGKSAHKSGIGNASAGHYTVGGTIAEHVDITAPATPDAERWQGWGTALKPAFEPVVVARKPLAGTVAANVLAHGTGALNVDGCRIPHRGETDLRESTAKNQHARFGTAPGGNNIYGDFSTTAVKDYDGSAGRWPANVVLDESQAAALDEQSGESASRAGGDGGTFFGEKLSGKEGDLRRASREGHTDSGGASRFFPTFRYEAKAPATERPRINGTAHPTVKPLDLMRWLVRLVTPPGGVVLEPFAGSGTTVEACLLEGFRCIAIEREAEYLPLVMQRLNRRRDPIAYLRTAGDDLGLFTDQETA